MKKYLVWVGGTDMMKTGQMVVARNAAEAKTMYSARPCSQDVLCAVTTDTTIENLFAMRDKR